MNMLFDKGVLQLLAVCCVGSNVGCEILAQRKHRFISIIRQYMQFDALGPAEGL